MNLRLGLLFFVLIVFLSSCDDDHGNFTFQHKGKTYAIVKDRKTWEQAAAYAVKHDARLIEIMDTDLQSEVMYQLDQGARVSPAYTSIKDGGCVAYLWIGATDKAKEGNWIWDGANVGRGPLFFTGQGANGKADGHAITYVNWGGTAKGKIQEPDNYAGHQNAAAIALAPWPDSSAALGQAGEWNDLDINDKLYFIIQYNKM
jgi:hypothetical protein